MHDAKSSLALKPVLAQDPRFLVRLAANRFEIESALRLRYRVFSEELGCDTGTNSELDLDAHDDSSEHLLLIDRQSGKTIGTYRMKTIERAGSASGFYSNDEFTLDTLPKHILRDGVETGRACIESEHRSTRAIFLLWKGLARHLSLTGKRFFFGCCSIFTRDPQDGLRAYKVLESQGFVHDRYVLQPRLPIPQSGESKITTERIILPGLFQMYLRIGSRVCGPPIYDEKFGTVDFFVVFDLQEMSPKYRQMFLED